MDINISCYSVRFNNGVADINNKNIYNCHRHRIINTLLIPWCKVMEILWAGREVLCGTEETTRYTQQILTKERNNDRNSIKSII